MKSRFRNYIFILSIISLILFFAVKSYITEKRTITWYDVIFSLRSGQNSVDIRLWHNYNDDKDYLFLPSFISGENEKPQLFVPAKKRFTWDEVIDASDYIDADLSAGTHTLKIGKDTFEVNVMHSSNVPSLFIETASGKLDYIEAEKGNSESGMYKLIDENGTVIDSGELSKMRARGNVTFFEDKKPYQINLAEMKDLTGSGPQDKYVLLANRQDQSLIRNSLVFKLAKDVGLINTPESIFLDLYINSDYRGSYQLCDKIDTGENSVEIDTETNRVQTDYLLSLEYNAQDRLEDEPYAIQTDFGQNAVIKRPKMPTEAQIDFIKNDFNSLQREIKNGNLERIDLNSFSSKYLVEEFSKNLDAMHTSQNFYRDRDTIFAGPVWDYDKTLGNPLIEHNRPVDFQEPRGIYAATVQNGASWWYDLYNLEVFRRSSVKIYEERLLPSVGDILDREIDDLTGYIWESARMDNVRWDSFEDQKYGIDRSFDEGYNEQLDIIRDFVKKRREFFNDIWLESKRYDMVPCDPGEGTMYVRYIDAVEGKKLTKPAKPDWEGHEFSFWARNDTGEEYDFESVYDGVPFELKAVYDR